MVDIDCKNSRQITNKNFIENEIDEIFFFVLTLTYRSRFFSQFYNIFLNYKYNQNATFSQYKIQNIQHSISKSKHGKRKKTGLKPELPELPELSERDKSHLQLVSAHSLGTWVGLACCRRAARIKNKL